MPDGLAAVLRGVRRGREGSKSSLGRFPPVPSFIR